MKKLIYMAVLIAFCACDKHSTDDAQEESSNDLDRATAMTSFIVKFENVEVGKSYDYDWLFNFTKTKTGKEISREECEKFIAGKSIINHLFDGKSEKTLSCDRTYYRVANIPSRPDITTLIISDGKAESYLCTFDASGNFVSGIVLQYYSVNGESETFRNGGLADGGTKIILKDAKQGANLAPMVVYEIGNDGKINTQN